MAAREPGRFLCRLIVARGWLAVRLMREQQYSLLAPSLTRADRQIALAVALSPGASLFFAAAQT